AAGAGVELRAARTPPAAAHRRAAGTSPATRGRARPDRIEYGTHPSECHPDRGPSFAAARAHAPTIPQPFRPQRRSRTPMEEQAQTPVVDPAQVSEAGAQDAP